MYYRNGVIIMPTTEEIEIEKAKEEAKEKERLARIAKMEAEIKERLKKAADFKESMQRKLDSVKDKIAPELLNNPRFLKAFNGELEGIGYFSGRDTSYLTNVVVSADGKSVTIDSGQTYPNKQSNPELSDNAEYSSTTISLGEKNDMQVVSSKGTLYHVDGYKKAVTDPTKKAEYARLESEGFKTILVTNYRQEIYDQNGIEYSISDFSDQYPFKDEYRDIILNKEILTYSHKPTFSSGLLPGLPNHTWSASAQTISRTDENLGVCTVLKGEGMNSNGNKGVKYSQGIYPVNTEYPENLSVIPNPLMIGQGNGAYVGTDYAGTTGQRMEDVLKDAALSFEENLETSKTKEYSPETYRVLKNKLAIANAQYRTSSNIQPVVEEAEMANAGAQR